MSKLVPRANPVLTYLFLALIILAVISFFFLKPVYKFYAHTHSVPMLSTNYLSIPEHSPKSEIIHDANYEDLAGQAISVIENHKNTINSPGISAAVAIDGKLVWAGTSGWSDIENQQALTPSTQFRIGSTSKAINATLLAKMIEQGAISLDTPLSEYAVGKQHKKWGGITPRQLASHTAGIPHYNKNNDWLGLYEMINLQRHYSNVAESVSLFDDSATLFSPGESFEYSSLGTVLLSAVMQEAINMKYQDAMQETVFAPLKMKDSGYESAINHRQVPNTNLATFYWHPDYSKNKVQEWRQVDLSHRLAGGGFVSTPSDLVKLGIGFNSNNYLNDEIRDEFWTPQALNDGTVNEQNYAIGWRVAYSDFGEGIGELFHANHGGVSRGAQSWLMVIPEYNMAVAVNINAKTDSFWDFAEVSFELVRLFLLKS